MQKALFVCQRCPLFGVSVDWRFDCKRDGYLRKFLQKSLSFLQFKAIMYFLADVAYLTSLNMANLNNRKINRKE